MLSTCSIKIHSKVLPTNKTRFCVFFQLHCGRHCADNAYQTLIFPDSLKKFFEDENNTWEEKKYFKGLYEESKNIFLNIF